MVLQFPSNWWSQRHHERDVRAQGKRFDQDFMKEVNRLNGSWDMIVGHFTAVLSIGNTAIIPRERGGGN